MKSFSAAGRVVPVEVVARAQARRLTLRADPVAGVVRISSPRGVAQRHADRLIAENSGWLTVSIAGWPLPLPLEAGAVLPFDGASLAVDWQPVAGATARCGARLIVGGRLANVRNRVLRWLRAAALADLTAQTVPLAQSLGRTVTVGVRDPASRWGSCTAGGAISYSWRLIMAPPSVRQSVVAHEVAHLVHHNHGTAFWTLATQLTTGDLPTARAWLRANGAALHWVGRPA